MDSLADLKAALKSARISSDAYSLPGQYPKDESLVLASVAMDRFAIYYSERGQWTGTQYFDRIEDAVKRFYERISDDASAREPDARS